MLRALALLSTLAFPAVVAAQGATPAAAPTTAAPSDADLIALGRKLTEWMYAGRVDSIYAHMSADSRAHKDQDTFEQDRQQILSRIGAETVVIEDKMTMRKGNRQYWRESLVDGGVDGSIVLRWVFNPQGEVIGVGISPRASAPAPDAPTGN